MQRCFKAAWARSSAALIVSFASIAGACSSDSSDSPADHSVSTPTAAGSAGSAAVANATPAAASNAAPVATAPASASAAPPAAAAAPPAASNPVTATPPAAASTPAAPAGSAPPAAASADKPATATAAEWPDKCDEVYTIKSHGAGGDTSPYMVPPGQEVHPEISVPAPWGNDAVQMISMRALTDNKKVTHHWILYGPRSEFLVGWAPGKDQSAPLPADVGMNLPGGTLRLDMHYNNLVGEKAEPDNSGLELCVLKKEHFRPNTATVNQTFSQFLINIPAHSTNFDVTGQCTFTGNTPVTVVTASPHAHTLARHMKFTVKKKSGEMIVMHDDAFDFNEQASYPLTPTIKLENGDVVTTTCTYDNPGDTAVTFGENTGNEMCFNFAVYYPMGAMACGAGTFAGGLPGGPPAF